MSYNRLYTYQPCALRSLLAALALTLAATNVSAQTALASLSSKDQTTGLKTALTQAAQAAVGRLGKTDGFLADPEVRIPLPGKLEKAQRTLKMLGLNKQTDELVTAMNRVGR